MVLLACHWASRIGGIVCALSENLKGVEGEGHPERVFERSEASRSQGPSAGPPYSLSASSCVDAGFRLAILACLTYHCNPIPRPKPPHIPTTPINAM
jgi:hypothetical protein